MQLIPQQLPAPFGNSGETRTQQLGLAKVLTGPLPPAGAGLEDPVALGRDLDGDEPVHFGDEGEGHGVDHLEPNGYGNVS